MDCSLPGSFIHGIFQARVLDPAPGGNAPAGRGKSPVTLPAAVETPEIHRDLFRVSGIKNGFRLDYSDPGSKLYFGVTVTDGDAGRTVVVERSGRRELRRFLWSIRPENWEYEFND